MQELKQLLEVIETLQGFTSNKEVAKSESKGLNHLIGEYVIIRTYSAGVWFGKLVEKDGKEVILHDARRMWKWWAKESISLSGVAKYGIKQDESKIVEPVKSVWLEAIEIIECEDLSCHLSLLSDRVLTYMLRRSYDPKISS